MSEMFAEEPKKRHKTYGTVDVLYLFALHTKRRLAKGGELTTEEQKALLDELDREIDKTEAK